MRYSELFAKTKKQPPKGAESANHQLLVRAGFVDQLMSGSFTLLPLGLRVVKKIEQIIREEMNSTGAQEVLMPLLHPKEIWNETGRWDTAREVMYQFEKEKKEYALSFTHEEIVLDLIRKHAQTYRDFPIKIYHFSTKFRDELRAKSGVLRTREFLMKDLYSAHTSEEDLKKYYWEVSEAYKRVFKRVGFEAKIAEAAGGVFTDRVTHEFQAFCETGEDTIYYCPSCDFAQNKEIAKVKEGDLCPKCGEKIQVSPSIEVGNIFNFGTTYSEKMDVGFTDHDGKRKMAYFASYGIGVTRLMGILVELFHDEKGIIWPESVAPYKIHLVEVKSSNLKVKSFAEDVYKKLVKSGIEVLYDDRGEAGAGEKFADADLIGCPIRIVVSEKTLVENAVEVKRRNSTEVKLVKLDEVTPESLLNH